MPVSNVSPIIEYIGNGVTTVYPFPFKTFLSSDLQVFVDSVIQVGGYTVAGLGADVGGTITFSVAPAIGAIVQIVRQLPFDRKADYQPAGAFREDQVDKDQDIQTMQIQQLARDIGGFGADSGRVMRLVDGDPVTGGRFDSRDNRIIDVKNPEEPKDAVNLQTLDSAIASATLNGVGIKSLVSYGALRLYSGSDTLVYVAGRTNDQDGAANFYAVDEADTTSADNDGDILVDAISRRWKVQANFIIKSSQFSDLQKGLDAAEGKIFEFVGANTTAVTLVIPNNTSVTFAKGASLTLTSKGKFAALAIMPGSINISIADGDIRGPWYGTGVGDWVNKVQSFTAPTVDGDTWQDHLAENIGIDIRGRWYQREVLGYTYAQMQALTDANNRITITGCRIDGFGQSGILADQCTNLKIENSTILNCGRDGIRMYGAFRAAISDNTVGNIKPGFAGNYPNFNVYGITATRLYGKAGFADPNLTIGRPSEQVTIYANSVYNCHTWKSIDTHGGRKIKFIGNSVLNSYIGVGIDHGGIDSDDGICPAQDIIVSGNTIESKSANYMRAGTTAYGNNKTDSSTNIVVTGNTYIGYGGGDTDGAISLSNINGATISGNTIDNAPRCAVNLSLSCQSIAISGNAIKDPKSYISVAVTSGGSGYTPNTAPDITFSGGGGTGLKAVATVSGGAVTSISIVHPGIGYTSAPTVSFSYGAATATAAFNIGYGVLSQTTDATGAISGNTFSNDTQANQRSISLQAPAAGTGVAVSQDNTFAGTGVTKVYPTNSNNVGGSYGRTAWAMARVTSAGAITSNSGIASVTKTGTGTYDVVLERTASSINNLIPDATPYGTLGTARASLTSANSLTVTTSNIAGSAADIGFVLTVWNILP